MATADLITRLKQDFDDVYAAGKAAGGGSGDYDQGYEDGYEVGKKESFDEGFGAGKQAEYNTFWDSYQNNGNRTDYGNAFGGVGWNDTTFKPKYPITISGTSVVQGDSTFASANMTEINVNITLDISSWRNAFDQNRSIVTIKKIVLARDNIEFDRTFQYVTNLVNITFEGVIGKSISFSHSQRLSEASVQNIIDCLADLTGGTAQTLTLHATVGSKLTDEQKATITAKNWELVY